MITVYGIKSCGSVQKALQFFNQHSLEFTFVDFKISPVQLPKITQWKEKSDLALLLNTKGTTYRNLGLKVLNLDESQKVQWMNNNNLLIKRPVIEFNDEIIVGFNLSNYEGIFLS
jgi:Spx/MgsR family transcriptional regulator